MATATTTGAPVVQNVGNNYAFARSVLGALGPTYVTDNNVNNFVRWIHYENNDATWFRNNNPLNVMTNGTDAASSTYPSISAAVQGTAGVISQSNMAAIKNALASNAPWPAFSAAVNSSPWGTSITGNVDVVPVVDYNGTVLGAGATLAASLTHTPGTCDPNKYTINGPFGLKLLSQCSTKALAGGLCVGLGAVALGFGVLILVGFGLSATGAGKAAKQVVSAGPSGRAVKGVSSVAKRVGARTGLEARTRRRGNEQAARDEIDYARYEMDRPAREERNKRYRAEQGAAKRAGYDRVA